ncbi:MAG: protein-L-isoaspartate(D-aspartate) O-methyltransferase [Paludibacteraceae bacterium]
MQTEARERRRMVKEHIVARGIKDRALLAVLRKIPRHLFVPGSLQSYAYADKALPASCGQSISQPFIVAKMTELLHLSKRHKVLEIGTGTGYQTAILAELSEEVYTMEIIPEMYETAKSNPVLKNYHNVHFIKGNGYAGYPPAAPYDAVIVTAAPSQVPKELVNQLSPGGRMVVPVGDFIQELQLITKEADNTVNIFPILGVSFVPMTGRP